MFKKQAADNQIRYVAIFFLILTLWIIIRLFILQVIQHDYYSLFALNTHEMYQKLHSRRGTIFFQDSRTKEEYVAAINKLYYLVYAVPREISPAEVNKVTNKVAEILDFNDEQKNALREKLAQPGESYKSIAKKVEEEKVNRFKEEKLPGIYYVGQEYRYYPDENLAASVLGFSAPNDDGNLEGHYGLEGYWDKKLAGKGGFLSGERTALGSWIALASRNFMPAESGADILLTIDRALQFKLCERLRQGLEEYQAKSASLVLMNPKTGAILAMCSLPDFDPNNYSKMDNMAVFNNNVIFTPYEPGSVFKPVTMAAALDLNLVNPQTTFDDPCVRSIDDYQIYNAMKKCYGQATMTQVLENSINTGIIWVEEKLGRERFKDYVEKFGFGQRTGITLSTEVAGNISSFEKKSAIYAANGSFGQGFTVTLLQLATAYSALANDGQIPTPYIVEEVRYPNGRVERLGKEAVERVISARTAKLLTGMLISVVENHTGAAKIDGYYVAGKTGTAQVPGLGGYTEATNHTFIGFAPANNPRFVLAVKYEEPSRRWAEATAAPVFHDGLKFALEYYGIPPER